MGIFKFDGDGPDHRASRRSRGRAPGQIGASVPPGRPCHADRRRDAVRRLDGHLRVLARGAASTCSSSTRTSTSAREVIPASLSTHRRRAVPVPRLLGRRGHHRRRSTTPTSSSRSAGRPSTSTTPTGRSTRTPLPAASRFNGCDGARIARRRGLLPRRVPPGRVGRRHSHTIGRGRDHHAARCCSAPTSTTREDAPARRDRPARSGIGRDVVLDRVIVDKNARIGDGVRLVNEAGVHHADGGLLHPQRASSSCRRVRPWPRARWSDATA